MEPDTFYSKARQQNSITLRFYSIPHTFQQGNFFFFTRQGKIYYIYAYLPFGSIKHPSFNFVMTLSVPSLLLNIIIAWPRSYSQNMIIFSSNVFIKQNMTYHIFLVLKTLTRKEEKIIRQVEDIGVFHTRVGGRYFGALHHFCRTMLL